tara:strand:- start:2120 stop:2818 length:699 start_codon:yes stop_codon:yes gene_type:complete
MPNWPVTTTSITEGTIIKASDLENNFNVLKNAANTLHERFSTLSFSCNVSTIIPETFTSSGDVQKASLATHGYYTDLTVQEDIDAYPVFAVFQVPAFCQAVRVRTVDVLNSSVLPDASGVVVADDSTPLEVGVRYISAMSGWDQNAASAPGTSIASLTFNYSGDDAKGLTGSAAGAPVLKQATPSTLVLGGQYIVVYGRGGLTYTLDSSEKMGPTHYRFHVNMMCDAMVPIP